RHVPGREPARGLRAPDPRRPRRRPHSVHALGRDRAALGSVRGSARRFAPAPPVRARLVGSGRDARPDRPTPLAPARGRAMRSTTRAVLFDTGGTLIGGGGAGAVAGGRALGELCGIPADIGAFTDAGMTDPEVGLRTFTAAVGRAPRAGELDEVMEARVRYLPQAVAESRGYAVLPGVVDLLPMLEGAGYLLGLATGRVEAAARIKLAPGGPH